MKRKLVTKLFIIALAMQLLAGNCVTAIAADKTQPLEEQQDVTVLPDETEDIESGGNGLEEAGQKVEEETEQAGKEDEANQEETEEADSETNTVMPFAVNSESTQFVLLERSGWSVTATSERPETHEAKFAIDGNPASIWHTAKKGETTYNMPHTFVVNLGKKDCKVSKIELTGRTGTGLNGFPKELEVQSSSDGGVYTKVQDVTFSKTPTSGMVETIELETPINEQYIRLVIKNNWFTDGDQSVSFAELNMYQQVEEDVPAEISTIESPNGEFKTSFWMSQTGRPMYSVLKGEENIVLDSSLGLVLNDENGGSMTDNMTLISKEDSTNDTSWQPVVKLTTGTIKDAYNQTIFHLKDDKNRKVDIIFRSYNEGVAFRYYFPEEENALKDFEIKSEESQFAIPAGTTAHAYDGRNQAIPGNTLVENLGTSARNSPMVFEYQSGNTAAAIYESDLYDYDRLKLQHSSNGVLTSKIGMNKAQVPFETPWRAICIADQIGELQVNQTLMMNLADECALKDTSWIKPGPLIREAKLTDDNTIKCIDFAAEHNIPYIMYDSGWYGTEDDVAYSPMVPFKGEFPYLKGGSTMRTCDVNIKDHIEYANSKGVGIILYVNRVHLENYDLDEVFKTYQEWGIKGVKFGFVQSGTQKWSKWLEDSIATAAKYEQLVIVHDEVIPSGLERTYPNLVNMEGVLGDEGTPNAANDLKQVFTRTILGSTDHCFCMPVQKYGRGAGKTDAYNMANSVLFYAPTPSLYWYGDPDGIMEEERPELKFWDDMPMTWDESKHIDSKFGEYYTMARRSGEEWFLGSTSAIDRTFVLEPTYLESGRKYVAEIYTNGAGDKIGNNKIQVSRYIIDSSMAMEFNIMAAGGLSVRMAPATQEEIDTIPMFDPARAVLENVVEKVHGMDMSQYTDASVRNSYIMEVLEEAEGILEKADADSGSMQAVADKLNGKIDELVLKTWLLNKIDQSTIKASTDNERDAPMNVGAAFDGNANTKWHTKADDNPPFDLTMDFSASKRIRKIEILGRNDNLNGYPLVFDVLTSDDGENFTKVMEVDWTGNSISKGCMYSFNLPDEVNAQYIRLHFTDSFISGSSYKPVSIAELNAYETQFGELDDLISEGNGLLEVIKDENAKAELQESVWAAIDYEQTAENVDELESQVQKLADAIAKAKEFVPDYAVAYDLAGGLIDGNDSIPNLETVFDGSGLIPEEVPVKTGYKFIGWKKGDKEVNADTKYSELAADKNEKVITMQAQWKAVNYKVKFDKNADNAAGEMSDQKFTYDQEQKLTKNAYSYKGYTFVGWSMKKDNQGKADYKNEQAVKNLSETDDTVVLYAVWEKEQNNVPGTGGDKPSNGNGQNNGSQINKNPQTGDTTASSVFFAISAMALAVIAAVFVMKKRRA